MVHVKVGEVVDQYLVQLPTEHLDLHQPAIKQKEVTHNGNHYSDCHCIS